MKAVRRYLFISADVTIWKRGKGTKADPFYIGCGIIFQVLAERICST